MATLPAITTCYKERIIGLYGSSALPRIAFVTKLRNVSMALCIVLQNKNLGCIYKQWANLGMSQNHI